MGIVALVTGALALIGLALSVPLESSIPGLVGIALSVIALVTGIVGRRQKTGIAGLVLGAIGLSLVGIGFFMFRAGPTMSTAPAPAMSAPVIAPAKPMAAPPPQSK